MFDEPKDLFEEKAPANLPVGSANKPVAAIAQPPAVVATPKNFLWIVGLIFIIALAALATFFLLWQRSSQDLVDEEVLKGETGLPAGRHGGTEEEAAVPEQEGSAPREQVTIVDSDGDGLTDAQELEAGTDPDDSDSDDDDLGDRAEVEVYGTDPLNRDTDGDSYLDGSEVSSGYNPNGPGKLFQVP